MNVEGAVKLGFSKELAAAAAESPQAHEELYAQLLAAGYDRGSALNVARTLETDDVIDPAESRQWVAAALAAPDAEKFPSSPMPLLVGALQGMVPQAWGEAQDHPPAWPMRTPPADSASWGGDMRRGARGCARALGVGSCVWI